MNIRDYFTYGYTVPSDDPIKSTDLGLAIEAINWWDAPEKDFSMTNVDGRSGAIVTDNNRYNNKVVTITVSLVSKDGFYASDLVHRINKWLLIDSGELIHGYRILGFSGDPGHFLRARYTGNIKWDMINLERHGKTALQFTCCPFRYDVPAETWLNIGSGASGSWTVQGTREQIAFPLIRIQNAANTAKITVTRKDNADTVENVWQFGGNREILIDCESGLLRVDGSVYSYNLSSTRPYDRTFPYIDNKMTPVISWANCGANAVVSIKMRTSEI